MLDTLGERDGGVLGKPARGIRGREQDHPGHEVQPDQEADDEGDRGVERVVHRAEKAGAEELEDGEPDATDEGAVAQADPRDRHPAEQAQHDEHDGPVEHDSDEHAHGLEQPTLATQADEIGHPAGCCPRDHGHQCRGGDGHTQEGQDGEVAQLVRQDIARLTGRTDDGPYAVPQGTEPAQSRPEQAEEADRAGPRQGRAGGGIERDEATVAILDEAREQAVEIGPDLLEQLLVALEDDTEDGEGQGQRRKEGEEGEVGDAARKEIAPSIPITLPGAPHRGALQPRPPALEGGHPQRLPPRAKCCCGRQTPSRPCSKSSKPVTSKEDRKSAHLATARSRASSGT